MTCTCDDARCRELCERLSDYIDGEMAAPERHEFEAHLFGCLGCHCCLQALRRTISLCRHTARQPVPAGVSARLGALVRSLTKSV
jgi:anti-sigma factor RsiW